MQSAEGLLAQVLKDREATQRRAQEYRDRIREDGEKAVGVKMVDSDTNDPEQFYVICQIREDGDSSISFLKKVEEDLFTPCTDKNGLFQLSEIVWFEGQYCIAGVPKEYAPQVKAVAAEIELTLINGFPRMRCPLGSGTVTVPFPLRGPNVWVLQWTE